MKILPKLNKGFTLIEVLVVMAIMATLLALSVAGLYSVQQNSDTVTEAQNVLSDLNKARNYSIDERVSSISNNTVFGYIFEIENVNSNHFYCINQWYSLAGNSDPTQPGYSFPGTLTQNITNGAPNASFNPPVDCPDQTNQNDGFFVTDAGILDNRNTGGITAINFNYLLNGVVNNSIKYVIFENLSGNVYFYDSSGHYIPATNNATVSLKIQDAHGNFKQIYLQTAGSNEPPYISF